MSDYPRDQRNRGNGDNSGIPWPLIIIAFCIFWPVGILLLLLKFSQAPTAQGGLGQRFEQPRYSLRPAARDGRSAAGRAPGCSAGTLCPRP